MKKEIKIDPLKVIKTLPRMVKESFPKEDSKQEPTTCACGANTSCECESEEPKEIKVHWVGVVKWNDGTFYTTEPFYEYDEGIKVWSAEFSSKHQGEFESIDYERFDGVVRDLEYWKNNAEEDYIATPISVLRYISELEKEVERRYTEDDVKSAFQDGKDNMDYSETYGWSSKLTEQEWFDKIKKK